MQGLFSGEIVRDSLIFWPKISLKLAKWEEISHTKQLFSQTILPVFKQKIHNFSLVLAWREIFYEGILEPELSLYMYWKFLRLTYDYLSVMCKWQSYYRYLSYTDIEQFSTLKLTMEELRNI